jgi:PIN domain nuclease of toxin-antitoxin system
MSALRDPANVLYFSAVSVWEITTKRNKGALRFDGEVQAAAARYGLLELPISWAHADIAGSLPLLHRDPFDRMLVAQAQVEDLTIATTDADIRRYSVAVL